MISLKQLCLVNISNLHSIFNQRLGNKLVSLLEHIQWCKLFCALEQLLCAFIKVVIFLKKIETIGKKAIGLYNLTYVVVLTLVT